MVSFDYTVQRTSRKKSATIKVENKEVIVVVPKTLSKKRINELVEKKSPWINKKLHEYENLVPTKPKEYVSGESFTYLGRNYRLKIIEGASEEIKLKHGQLVIGNLSKESEYSTSELIRSSLENWYIERANEKLIKKNKRYSKLIGVNPRSIKVKSYKSRWGSCTVKGDVSYNWKIVIAPNRIIDYLVIHELCHLIHHNHSPLYWKTVENYCSDYKESREWLRINGSSLLI